MSSFHFKQVQKRTFPKAFLAQSRDVDTGSCHRASDAPRRYKSGTGLASGITSASPGIIVVIAALSLIHCQTFGGNDNERMAFGSGKVRMPTCSHKDASPAHSVRCVECAGEAA